MFLCPSYLTASAASGAFHTSLYHTVTVILMTMESLGNNCVASQNVVYCANKLWKSPRGPECDCVLTHSTELKMVCRHLLAKIKKTHFYERSLKTFKGEAIVIEVRRIIAPLFKNDISEKKSSRLIAYGYLVLDMQQSNWLEWQSRSNVRWLSLLTVTQTFAC